MQQPPQRRPSHYNYDYALSLIKEQLGSPPDYLEDIPVFRIPDLQVTIQNNWKGRVQEILQSGRSGDKVSQEEIYLHKHIGWFERHCHKRAQKAERANLTTTDRKPEFFFSTEKKPNKKG